MGKKKSASYRKLKQFPPGGSCSLCLTTKNNPALLGEIYQICSISLHYLCLLSASEVVQRGSDDEGLLGFFSRDIKNEMHRCTKKFCLYCKKKGATIKCSEQSCSLIFHLPCGLKNGSLHQYFKGFRSFCPEHKPKQEVPTAILNSKSDCPICFSEISALKEPYIWPPCCKPKVLLHKECCQNYASNSGYLLKCPLCNNKEKFGEGIRQFGIYVPDQEATWEVEELNRGDDVNTVVCTASLSKECLCPRGPKYSLRHSAKWYIEVCAYCGSGKHLGCMSFKLNRNQEYKCEGCAPVAKRNDDEDSDDDNQLSTSLQRNLAIGSESAEVTKSTKGMSSNSLEARGTISTNIMLCEQVSERRRRLERRQLRTNRRQTVSHTNTACEENAEPTSDNECGDSMKEGTSSASSSNIVQENRQTLESGGPSLRSHQRSLPIEIEDTRQSLQPIASTSEERVPNHTKEPCQIEIINLTDSDSEESPEPSSDPVQSTKTSSRSRGNTVPSSRNSVPSCANTSPNSGNSMPSCANTPPNSGNSVPSCANTPPNGRNIVLKELLLSSPTVPMKRKLHGATCAHRCLVMPSTSSISKEIIEISDDSDDESCRPMVPNNSSILGKSPNNLPSHSNPVSASSRKCPNNIHNKDPVSLSKRKRPKSIHNQNPIPAVTLDQSSQVFLKIAKSCSILPSDYMNLKEGSVKFLMNCDKNSQASSTAEKLPQVTITLSDSESDDGSLPVSSNMPNHNTELNPNLKGRRRRRKQTFNINKKRRVESMVFESNPSAVINDDTNSNDVVPSHLDEIENNVLNCNGHVSGSSPKVSRYSEAYSSTAEEKNKTLQNRRSLDMLSKYKDISTTIVLDPEGDSSTVPVMIGEDRNASLPLRQEGTSQQRRSCPVISGTQVMKVSSSKLLIKSTHVSAIESKLPKSLSLALSNNSVRKVYNSPSPTDRSSEIIYDSPEGGMSIDIDVEDTSALSRNVPADPCTEVQEHEDIEINQFQRTSQIFQSYSEPPRDGMSPVFNEYSATSAETAMPTASSISDCAGQACKSTSVETSNSSNEVSSGFFHCMKDATCNRSSEIGSGPPERVILIENVKDNTSYLSKNLLADQCTETKEFEDNNIPIEITQLPVTSQICQSSNLAPPSDGMSPVSNEHVVSNHVLTITSGETNMPTSSSIPDGVGQACNSISVETSNSSDEVSPASFDCMKEAQYHRSSEIGSGLPESEILIENDVDNTSELSKNLPADPCTEAKDFEDNNIPIEITQLPMTSKICQPSNLEPPSDGMSSVFNEHVVSNNVQTIISAETAMPTASSISGCAGQACNSTSVETSNSSNEVSSGSFDFMKDATCHRSSEIASGPPERVILIENDMDNTSKLSKNLPADPCTEAEEFEDNNIPIKITQLPVASQICQSSNIAPPSNGMSPVFNEHVVSNHVHTIMSVETAMPTASSISDGAGQACNLTSVETSNSSDEVLSTSFDCMKDATCHRSSVIASSPPERVILIENAVDNTSELSKNLPADPCTETKEFEDNNNPIEITQLPITSQICQSSNIAPPSDGMSPVFNEYVVSNHVLTIISAETAMPTSSPISDCAGQACNSTFVETSNSSDEVLSTSFDCMKDATCHRSSVIASGPPERVILIENDKDNTSELSKNLPADPCTETKEFEDNNIPIETTQVPISSINTQPSNFEPLIDSASEMIEMFPISNNSVIINNSISPEFSHSIFSTLDENQDSQKICFTSVNGEMQMDEGNPVSVSPSEFDTSARDDADLDELISQNDELQWYKRCEDRCQTCFNTFSYLKSSKNYFSTGSSNGTECNSSEETEINSKSFSLNEN